MQSCTVIHISSATEISRKCVELEVENPSLIRNGNRFSFKEEISDRCTHLTACFSISLFFSNALFFIIQSRMLHSAAVTFDLILPSSNMYTKNLSITEDVTSQHLSCS